MSEFHDRLLCVHSEIWSVGTDASPELEALLDDLAEAPLPAGVTRLASSRMAPGPHLAAQGGAMEAELPLPSDDLLAVVQHKGRHAFR